MKKYLIKGLIRLSVPFILLLVFFEGRGGDWLTPTLFCAAFLFMMVLAELHEEDKINTLREKGDFSDARSLEEKFPFGWGTSIFRWWVIFSIIASYSEGVLTSDESGWISLIWITYGIIVLVKNPFEAFYRDPYR